MSDAELLEQIGKLPSQQKKALKQYVKSLLQEKSKEPKLSIEMQKQELRKKGFGALKGKIKMLEGFDDPIEGFDGAIFPEDD